MGKLITLSDFHCSRDRRIPVIDASWYFSDAYWSGESNQYLFNWPSSDFPHAVHVHDDKLGRGYGNSKKERVRIRKWIEWSIPDTVIIDTVENRYRKYYGKDYEWDRSYDVDNSWSRFSFENGESATMFALAFSELVSTPQAWHPDRPEDEEYLKTLKSRY
jgi:hypothetical protein